MKIKIVRCMVMMLIAFSLAGCAKENATKEMKNGNEPVELWETKEAKMGDVLYKAENYSGPTGIFADLYPNRYVAVDGEDKLMPMTVKEFVDMLGISVKEIPETVPYHSQFEENRAFFADQNGDVYTVWINTEKYHYEHENELFNIDVFLEQPLIGISNEMIHENQRVQNERMPLQEIANVNSDAKQMQLGYARGIYGEIDYIFPNYMVFDQFRKGTLPENHYGTAGFLENYVNAKYDLLSIQYGDITGDGYDDMIISSEKGKTAFGVNMEDGKIYELFHQEPKQGDMWDLKLSSTGCLYTSYRDEYKNRLFENAYYVDFDGNMKQLVAYQSDGYGFNAINNKRFGDEYTEVRVAYTAFMDSTEEEELLYDGHVEQVSCPNGIEFANANLSEYYKKLRENAPCFGEYEEIFDIQHKEVWQEAYKKLILSFINGEFYVGDGYDYRALDRGAIQGVAFSLYDMNHDEIPELFVGWQNAEGYMENCAMFHVGNGYEDSLVEHCILQINPKDQKIMSSDIYHLCENYYFYSYDGNNAILDYSLLWENPQVVDVDSSRWSMRVGDAMSDVEITMPQYQDIVESYMTDDMFTPIGKLMNAYNLKRYFDIDLNAMFAG